jgi:hypothetical protein
MVGDGERWLRILAKMGFKIPRMNFLESSSLSVGTKKNQGVSAFAY